MVLEIIKKIPLSKLIIEAICLIIALIGIVISIRMNVVGRSLWYDEAALAYSFVTRSFKELTASSLDLVQSAPVGWLYFVKIICKVFGYSDFVMRTPSIIAYVGVLILIYYISARILKMYYSMAPVAFAASMPLLLQYSNMFKPYICDAFFALLVICIYYWMQKEKINVYVAGIIWGVILWFSSTACFVEGGVIIAVFVVALISKDKDVIKKKFFELLKIGIIILIFFGILYIYWLRKVDNGMFGFWGDKSFPLIPTSLQDLANMKEMISEIAAPFYWFAALSVILVLAALILAIIHKDEIILSLHATLFVTSFASFLGMYPVNKRLWLFVYPLIIISMFYVIDFIVDKSEANYTKTNARNIIVGVCLICVCLYNGGIRYYMHRENVYWPRYEVKGEMEYLAQVVEPEDGIYVLSAARPMFLFYNNYDENTFEATGNSVVVGQSPFTIDYLGENEDHSAEIEYILSHDKCYIVMSDTWNEGDTYTKLYNILNSAGSFNMVYNEHDTPMFLFDKNK